MGMMRVVSLVLLLVGGVQSSTLYQWIVDSQTRFNYDPNPGNMLGVYNWPRTYSEDCGGLHQSPVDIQTDSVRYGVSCQCPRMIYPSSILRGNFKNNGHSAEFEPEDEMMLQLTNVPYRDGMYKMHDFHMHYGGVTGRDFELQGLRFRGSGIMSAGSEHTIDGLRFEGELHFVFYNTKYKDLEEADNKTDGVVVISILIQKLQGSISDSMETSRFSEFLEMNIPKIFPYQANGSAEVDLSIFFNRDCEFYTYAGSTTTPTCHESVRWIILKDPIMVTERAWFMLTGLQSRGDFNSRFGNYRTTQPLNDRVIEANFDRPNGPVLPSPNGEAMMLMMMDVMNMTMQMMNQPASMPEMNGNMQTIPMMLMERTASSPVGNVRDMPLMMMSMMSMMQNGNVPNLNGNVRSMPPMVPIPPDTTIPDLNGNAQNPSMLVMPMPMSPMRKGGTEQMMIGNARQMQSMMIPMQKDIRVPSMTENVFFMPRMAAQLNSPNIPNLIEPSPAMTGMMPMPIDMMTMMMPMPQSIPMSVSNMLIPQRNANVPNVNGNIRGGTMMRMRGRPTFNRNILQNISRDLGRSRMLGMQRPTIPSQPALNRISGIGSRRRNNNNNNNNMNDENNNNRNNNNNMNNNNNNNNNRNNNRNNNNMNNNNNNNNNRNNNNMDNNNNNNNNRNNNMNNRFGSRMTTNLRNFQPLLRNLLI